MTILEHDEIMEVSPAGFRWKGLDPNCRGIFLGYDQTERMVAALLDRAVAWQPDMVVGIMRGGVVPATMAATMLGLPLAMIAFDRSNARAAWVGPPPQEPRVLLVDDGCSTGHTMCRVRDILVSEQRSCLTLAVVHDPETTEFVPDLSHPMRQFWRFPWERGETTPAGRAWRAAGHGPDRMTERPFIGIGLNDDDEGEVEVILAHRPPITPLTYSAVPIAGQPVVISTQAESERIRIQSVLAQHGCADFRLKCRPGGCPDDIVSLARYKADVATQIGCTHFIESHSRQAVFIAAFAPHLLVSWWSREMRTGYMVGVAAKRHASSV